MDGGVGGEERRRDGACALLKMASQCPRLSWLALTAFDFGIGSVGNVLEDSLKFDLAAVTDLVLTRASWSIWPLVLAQTPNLKNLTIPHVPISPGHRLVDARLPSLVSLSLGGLRRASQSDTARELLSMGSQSLRTVSLTTESDEADLLVPSLLSHAPFIETFTLLRQRPFPTPEFLYRPPSTALLNYFSSATTLRTLHLNYVLSQDFLDAFPPSLSTLFIIFPPPPRNPTRRRSRTRPRLAWAVCGGGVQECRRRESGGGARQGGEQGRAHDRDPLNGAWSLAGYCM